MQVSEKPLDKKYPTYMASRFRLATEEMKAKELGMQRDERKGYKNPGLRVQGR